jgi:nucleoside 2-deoxyribosyltransferase
VKLYVIAKYEEAFVGRRWIDVFERAGHSITFDWTRPGAAMTREQAEKDRQGVLDADAVVFVCERPLAYHNSLVELGMALATGKPVFMTGHAIDDRNLFLKLPSVRYDVETLFYETPELLARFKEAADRRAEAVQGNAGTERIAVDPAPQQAHDFTSFVKHWAP